MPKSSTESPSDPAAISASGAGSTEQSSLTRTWKSGGTPSMRIARGTPRQGTARMVSATLTSSRQSSW